MIFLARPIDLGPSWPGRALPASPCVYNYNICIHFAARRGLKERLEAGEHVLCAEGYLLALCRRGYVATGVWVPEFLIDHPEVLRSLHYEFIHAGSDVTEAYQVHANPALS